MLDALWNDARVALRSLAGSRGFVATTVVTLGLALALCVAVLAVANAYLFRTLPYPEAERLYSVRYAPPGSPGPRNMEALDWSAVADVIEHPIAWDLDAFFLLGGEQAEMAPGAWVTRGFVEGLGIRPALGRGFDPEAFLPHTPQVALISHRLWQGRFAGDPGIVGRPFTAYVSDRPEEAETFTIIGVLPRDFWHLNSYTDVLTPLRAPTYPYLVRLRAGVPPDHAARRITALVRAGTPGLPADWEVELTGTHDAYVARVRPILRAVGISAGLVLLVAWGNVAALLLIRAARRRKEIAVRLALGARRLAIARFLFVEVLLLVACATAVGLAAAGLAMQGIAPMVERELGRPAPGGTDALSLDLAVTLIAAAAGLLTAVAAALAPVSVAWRAGLGQALRSGSRTATDGRAVRRARSALIAAQIAASLTLLAASGLMIRSVVHLLRVDFGIRAVDVLSASITLRQSAYPDPAAQGAFYRRLIDEIARREDVRSVALVNWWPLQPRQPQPIQGADGAASTAGVQAVSPGYFDTLGVRIVAGRAFAATDDSAGEPVVMLSETLARRLSPSGAVVGSEVVIGESGPAPAPPGVRRVVGVVGDVRQTPDDADLADAYVPFLQAPGRFAWVHVRPASDRARATASVRAALAAIDREVALGTARPLQAGIDEQLARPRFLAWLLTAFGGVAALLTFVGLYGIIAYAVRQREREIAVRIALGAGPAVISRLFVRQGVVVLAAGLLTGLGAAVIATQMLESQLFGIEPADPVTLAVAAAGFGALCWPAMWWPARRAASIEPALALKEE